MHSERTTIMHNRSDNPGNRPDKLDGKADENLSAQHPSYINSFQ